MVKGLENLPKTCSGELWSFQDGDVASELCFTKNSDYRGRVGRGKAWRQAGRPRR